MDPMPPAAQATLVAVVSRLIPGDDASPGAAQAGVPTFVEQELTGPFAEAMPMVVEGLGALEATADQQHGRAFADLAAAEQDDLLRGVELLPFFEMVLQLTVDGFLCDPRHGGNRDLLGWRVVGYTGVLMAPTEEQQQIGVPIALIGTTVGGWQV